MMSDFAENPPAMLGEFDFIRTYLDRKTAADGLILGIGDDAAVIRPRAGHDLCFSSDMLLAGRHFFCDTAPEDLAHKIVAVNASDMAAMGAQPRWVLLSAALPELEENWLRRFCGSLFARLDHYGAVLVGGDTTRGNLVFNLTIVGEVPSGQGLRRSSAQVGDDIWVSGRIGSAAAALQHLSGRLTLPESLLEPCLDALLRPEARIALGRALLPVAHAAQDVSDGLAQDMRHILDASAVGAEINVCAIPNILAALPDEQRLPLVLCGGDDYELLFTAAPQRRGEVCAAAGTAATPVRRIGRITDTGYLKLTDSQGCELRYDTRGYDHFA